jgi:hypothetical protein
MGKCCVWVNSRKIREIKMRNLGPPESQRLLLDRIISSLLDLLQSGSLVEFVVLRHTTTEKSIPKRGEN